MKVAVPAEGPETSALVSSVLGRCPSFVLADTETGETRGVPNPGADAPGGAGIAATRFLVDEGIEVVLTHEVGPKAKAVLDGADVEIRAPEGRTVADALAAVRKATPS